MVDLSESRILIVDDTPLNVDLLVEALKREYKLSVALDGAAALRLVENNSPDLILLDIMMPGIDGYEVCRRLRAAEKTRELPIIFLSSLEDVANKAKGFEVGGNDYVTKPFEILEVKARVKSLLKAKAYADAVRESAERELRIAREIQMGILPADVAACASGTGLDVCALMEPAKQVGGDLYDVVRANDDTIVIAIGDVMGKGVPASLFMAVVMTLFRTIARQNPRPDEILTRLNDEVGAYNRRGMFVTMSCLAIDVTTGRTTGASGGHHAVLLVPATGPPRFVLPSSGMVIGLRPGQKYGAATMDLAHGDTLLMYTDGVMDAENQSGEEFTQERVTECFTTGGEPSAESAASKLLNAVKTFSAGAAQIDDIAVLAIRRE